MNCPGYYTFAFGRLKVGIRVNSFDVVTFTAGNILFQSLQLQPLKPAFNHLPAKLRGRGVRVRQQFHYGLRHRSCESDRRGHVAAISEIESEPLREFHQVACRPDGRRAAP